MVVAIAKAWVDSYFPTNYTLQIVVVLLTAFTFRAFAQGKRTDRERDLHGKVVLVTGGFTPLGATILQQLAQRGAHVIALTPLPLSSPRVNLLITLLRTTTNNEHIYAERVDLDNPHDIKTFCGQFLAGTESVLDGTKEETPKTSEKAKGSPVEEPTPATREPRLDIVLFLHEYTSIGLFGLFGKRDVIAEQEARETSSLATFLLTTLLLPAMLVAPAERDIRIVNVVNPFYAAAAALDFSPFTSLTGIGKSGYFPWPWPSKEAGTAKTKQIISQSNLLSEGTRSLRSTIYARHLQRILDALPSSVPVPKTEEGKSAVQVVKSKWQKTNIVAVTVSPGIARQSTVAPLLNADWTREGGQDGRRAWSIFGAFAYLLLQPLLRIFVKSPTAAIQTILHALFLPTPFKILSQTSFDDQSPGQPNPSSENPPTPQAPKPDLSRLEMPEEVLRPGALYRECAIVNLKVKLDPEVVTKMNDEPSSSSSGLKSQKRGDKPNLKDEVLKIEDDGEYGGELAGRLVWEAFERGLKVWEREVQPRAPSPPPEVEEGRGEATGSDKDKYKARVEDVDEDEDKDFYA